MNEDLVVSWGAVAVDTAGLPTNVLGYKVWNVTDPALPQLIGDVGIALSATFPGYVADASQPLSVAVSAYNSVGDGQMSDAVEAVVQSGVPAQVTGVQATIVPK